MPTLTLQGLTFAELQSTAGIEKLDALFLAYLSGENTALHQFISAYRQKTLALLEKDISARLIETAEYMQHFIVQLFSIETETEHQRADILQLDPIYQFKKEFVLKRAKRQLKKAHDQAAYPGLTDRLFSMLPKDITDPELAFATFAITQLNDNNEATLDAITRWCVLSLKYPTKQTENWVSLKLPQKIDFQRLIPLTGEFKKHANSNALEQRDGFNLTDARMHTKQVQNEANYCVYCHEKDDDFCSKGFPKSKKQPELGFKQNALGVTLTGCPLDEKISEMHLLRKSALNVAALAMIMRDNPMCPATGHRICNDCMKACIYQKQEPVNIPEIETRVLTDVLELPWGVEIYDLLTRWNPLRQEQFAPKPYNDYKVLIAGLGPAGFTLAYYLLMEGCHVTGFDGLKIEPLEETLLNEPIHSYEAITEPLDERLMTGFGGVAEYGITVRWDKNFLKLIYITLMRRKQFQAFGNVRFGGTVTVEDARRLGYDHLCIAVGAGLPKALPIPGSLAPGMRQANDFLMALQLTGALKKESLASLQIRMPILVVGGGLTGVDAATEAQAYYIRQIEKTAKQYHALCQLQDEQTLRQTFTETELTILDEHLKHARLANNEREKAALEQRAPDFISLMHAWGGVSIVYRRTLQESPAYISNHEELKKALDQGLFYIENAWPVSATLDPQGQIKGLLVKMRHHNQDSEWVLGEETTLPAKTILVATGAKLNIAYSFEHKDTFKKENGHYVPHEFKEGKLTPANTTEHCKSKDFGPFTSYEQDKFYVSFIGDSHPTFHGNVVKAIASAKQSFPKIISTIQSTRERNEEKGFSEKIKRYFSATVQTVDHIAAGIVQLSIHCPAAVHNFKPGQFFRVQNFETAAESAPAKAMPLFASRVDYDKQLLTFIVMDKGISSQILQRCKPGEAIALMGPTGVRSKIESNEEILIVGNALAVIQAQILSQFADEENAKITLITNESRFKPEGNIQVMHTDDFEKTLNALQLKKYNTLLIIGEPNFIKRIKAYKLENTPSFNKNIKAFVAAYAPMQCMLKGVCAQCLVWQKDPETGQRKKAVYACSWQHQPLTLLDLDNLSERLSQNSLQEKLANFIKKS